jgi:hypothetical protein
VSIVDRLKREPALILGLVGALFALGAAFGLDLTTEQTGAITAVVVAVLAVVTRQSVTPNATVTEDYEPKHGEDGQKFTGYMGGV